MTKRQLDAINRKLRACRRKHDPQYLNLNFLDLRRARKSLLNAYKLEAKQELWSRHYDHKVSVALAGPTGRLP